MHQESPELVTLRLALGQQLAASRDAAGMVQQQVAHKTGYSRSSVAKAETGRNLLTRHFWKTADELLKADGALLAGYEQVRTAKQDHDLQCRREELEKAYAEARAQAQVRQAASTPTPAPTQDADRLFVLPGQEAVPGLAGVGGAELADGLVGPLLYAALLSSPAALAVPAECREQLYEQVATLLHRLAKMMDRRGLLRLLRLLGCVATAVAASPVSSLDTEEQERLGKALASPGRVDAQVIGHIETIFQDCKRQEDTLGPHAVLHTVLAQRELVYSLLDECPAELRPQLLSVYSSMSSSVGHYFFDLDDVVSAMHYCDQARAAAQEARNTELAIYALCHMSYFSSWQGKAHAGIDFAAAARSLAGGTDDVLLQICIAERTGTAYAADGRYKEFMTEFDRAQAGFALPVDQRSPQSLAYWCQEGMIASKQSDCLLRLGKPTEAAASASRGLRLFDDSFTGDMAYCSLRLGMARLRSGEVEDAARVIGDGALLATRHRSARLTKEVRTARARLQPWQDTSAVKVLDERLVGYGMTGQAST